MASRSWMAALTLVLGLTTASPGQEPGNPGGPQTPPSKPSPGQTQPQTKAKPAETYQVTLELRIAGLGSKGCDLEIKPAHPACSFEPVVTHIDSRGRKNLSIANVTTRSADRDCTFAITIKEPGHPERTIHRGMRLAAPDAPDRSAPQLLTCYMTSPSTIARTLNETGAATKR